MLSPGQRFPQFKAPACVSIEKGQEFQTLTNNHFEGKWAVVYFYPKDFTFVCPTEIVEFDNRLSDFADRDAVVVGASTDNEFSHLAWRKDHEDLRKLKHPLLAGQKLALDLGIVHPEENVALRATFIVDPQGVIRFAAANDLSVGRNVNEIIRVLDGLQTDELCPCNWEPGQQTLG